VPAVHAARAPASVIVLMIFIMTITSSGWQPPVDGLSPKRQTHDTALPFHAAPTLTCRTGARRRLRCRVYPNAWSAGSALQVSE
jgi:hypothetical protein